MKSLKILYKELEERADFKIIQTNFGGGWEHISIDGKNRMPTWDEMCSLKDMFFEDSECCVQYHPPKSEYVNNLKYCLHLWKPIEQYSGVLPIPPSIFIGMKGVELDD